MIDVINIIMMWYHVNIDVKKTICLRYVHSRTVRNSNGRPRLFWEIRVKKIHSKSRQLLATPIFAFFPPVFEIFCILCCCCFFVSVRRICTTHCICSLLSRAAPLPSPRTDFVPQDDIVACRKGKVWCGFCVTQTPLLPSLSRPGTRRNASLGPGGGRGWLYTPISTQLATQGSSFGELNLIVNPNLYRSQPRVTIHR